MKLPGQVGRKGIGFATATDAEQSRYQTRFARCRRASRPTEQTLGCFSFFSAFANASRADKEAYGFLADCIRFRLVCGTVYLGFAGEVIPI